MLAVGAGGVCLDIFSSHLSFLSSFSLSLGDGPINKFIILSSLLYISSLDCSISILVSSVHNVSFVLQCSCSFS